MCQTNYWVIHSMRIFPTVDPCLFITILSRTGAEIFMYHPSTKRKLASEQKLNKRKNPVWRNTGVARLRSFYRKWVTSKASRSGREVLGRKSYAY